LTALSDQINIPKYRNFQFLGCKELIESLFNKQNVSFEILKDRIVYECAFVEPRLKEVDEFSVENAGYDDFEELVQMSLDNYIEEYSGQGQKDEDHMKAAVVNGIEKNRLFVLREGEDICSIVQMVNENHSLPMIGNLYTKRINETEDVGFICFG